MRPHSGARLTIVCSQFGVSSGDDPAETPGAVAQPTFVKYDSEAEQRLALSAISKAAAD